jgi:hypothetical protein
MLDTQHIAHAPAPRSGRGVERAVAAMVVAGLTDEQMSRLADLRVRAQRGAYDDDGYGTRLGSKRVDRRHEFARWLVQSGRLREDG